MVRRIFTISLSLAVLTPSPGVYDLFHFGWVALVTVSFVVHAKEAAV